MNKRILKSAAVLSVVLSSGCASIINDKEQTINITASNGAKVEGTINGMPMEAPSSVSMVRSNRDIEIIPTTEGCQPTTMESGITPYFWGNLLTGGLLGSSTDAASKKMWEYEESVIITCK